MERLPSLRQLELLSQKLLGMGVEEFFDNVACDFRLDTESFVFQVNGINTRELTCDEVIPLLKRAGRRLQLVVERVQRDLSP